MASTTQKENLNFGIRKDNKSSWNVPKPAARKALIDQNTYSQTYIPNKNTYVKETFIQPRETITSKLRKGAIANASLKEKKENVSKNTSITSKLPSKVDTICNNSSLNKQKSLQEKNKISTSTVSIPKNNVSVDTSALLKIKNLSIQVTSSESESQPLPPEDIDEQEYDNPILLGNYVQDIFNYLFSLEKKNPVKPHYLKNHPHIKEAMRSILVDWMVEVHHEFKLQQETLFLAVGILDRFLQKSPTATKKYLQLIGVGCLVIASKYEELIYPEISHFAYITDNSYTTNEIINVERIILKEIHFDLSIPIHSHFLRRFSKLAKAEIRQHTLAKYLMELTLIDHQWTHVPPSAVAAASLYLSLLITMNFKQGLWNNKLATNSHYSAEDLKNIIEMLAALLIKSQKAKYKAVTEKYNSSKNLKIVESISFKSAELLKLAGL